MELGAKIPSIIMDDTGKKGCLAQVIVAQGFASDKDRVNNRLT